MSSRIDTLLALFGLEHRRAVVENKYHLEHPFELVYPNIESVFLQENARADVYLREAMNLS